MKKLLMVLASAVSTFAAATPEINIGAMHSFIEADRTSLLKQIRNKGSSTAYVRVTTTEIEFTEDGNAKEKDIDREALLKGDGYGLVISPTRLIVPASGMQANRMVVMGERDVERYYRVRYVPVIPDSTKEFGLTSEQAETYEKDVTAGVSVMAGYGAIVVVRPSKVEYNTLINETSDFVTFTNQGNSTVVFDAFAQCKAKRQACYSYRVQYLRPGKTLTVEKQANKSFRFTLVEGKSKSEMAFGDL